MSQQILPISAIEKKLTELHLSGMLKTLDLRLKQATDDTLSYAEFFGLLLEDETNKRSDSKRQKLYKGARLPFEKGIEDFDFAFQPSIKKQEIMNLATLRFVERKANIILIGQPGTGKTHISVALALQALGYGKTVLFTTVSDMINTLQQSRADLSYQRKIQAYLKPDLLILDELGYKNMAERALWRIFSR
jgi:DNA replication protein DnaC